MQWSRKMFDFFLCVCGGGGGDFFSDVHVYVSVFSF